MPLLPWLVLVLAAGANQPGDPITIYFAPSEPATLSKLPKEELKALAKERGVKSNEVRLANAKLEKDLRKQHGGDWNKWPHDAQEKYWDLEEGIEEARFSYAVAQGPGTDQDRLKVDEWVRGDLSKKKTLHLVDTAAEADMVIQHLSAGNFKLTPGPRLQALLADKLDHGPLRSTADTRNVGLSLQHRYKLDEPYWTFTSDTAEQARVIENFVKANSDVLRAARQTQ
jgi:hypothetical protein